MSSLGFIELLAIIVTLGGFEVSPNPKAPSATEVMKYAPADTDFMAHLDLQAVVPSNYKALQKLVDHDIVKDQPATRAALTEMLREIDNGLLMAKGLSGLDIINDLHSITAWMQLPGTAEPKALAVLRGNFPADLIDRLSQQSGTPKARLEGYDSISAPDGSATLALKGRELLLGTPAWVAARLAKSWQPPRFKAGSSIARATEMLRDKPFFALVSKPSPIAAKRLLQEMGNRDNAATDLVSGHALAVVTLEHNGMDWLWQARSKGGYERAVMTSEGLLDLFRASHFASRGLATIALSALRSYAGTSREIDAFLRHETKVLALVTGITGDGKFRADVRKDPTRRTIAVRARGKKLSDVLPISGLLPAIAAGMFLLAGSPSGVGPRNAKAAPTGPAVEPAQSDPGLPRPAPGAAAAGLDVQEVYRAVKRARGM